MDQIFLKLRSKLKIKINTAMVKGGGTKIRFAPPPSCATGLNNLTIPEEKKVFGRNNGKLWRHLWSDEKKAWCAFSPSLSWCLAEKVKCGWVNCLHSVSILYLQKTYTLHICRIHIHTYNYTLYIYTGYIYIYIQLYHIHIQDTYKYIQLYPIHIHYTYTGYIKIHTLIPFT